VGHRIHITLISDDNLFHIWWKVGLCEMNRIQKTCSLATIHLDRRFQKNRSYQVDVYNEVSGKEGVSF